MSSCFHTVDGGCEVADLWFISFAERVCSVTHRTGFDTLFSRVLMCCVLVFEGAGLHVRERVWQATPRVMWRLPLCKGLKHSSTVLPVFVTSAGCIEKN
jgi:hypothetical protein